MGVGSGPSAYPNKLYVVGFYISACAITQLIYPISESTRPLIRRRICSNRTQTSEAQAKHLSETLVIDVAAVATFAQVCARYETRIESRDKDPIVRMSYKIATVALKEISSLIGYR